MSHYTALQRGELSKCEIPETFKRFPVHWAPQSTALKRGVNERQSIAEPLQRLARSELNQVSVRIAHHREVAHDSAKVHWRFNENILLPRKLGNAIDFFTRLTLKTEVIETRFYLILNYDQNENGILAVRCFRSEPNVVTAFRPPVANDRKSAKRNVEVD